MFYYQLSAECAYYIYNKIQHKILYNSWKEICPLHIKPTVQWGNLSVQDQGLVYNSWINCWGQRAGELALRYNSSFVCLFTRNLTVCLLRVFYWIYSSKSSWGLEHASVEYYGLHAIQLTEPSEPWSMQLSLTAARKCDSCCSRSQKTIPRGA